MQSNNADFPRPRVRSRDTRKSLESWRFAEANEANCPAREQRPTPNDDSGSTTSALHFRRRRSVKPPKRPVEIGQVAETDFESNRADRPIVVKGLPTRLAFRFSRWSTKENASRFDSPTVALNLRVVGADGLASSA
jgi:hypothetical protein